MTKKDKFSGCVALLLLSAGLCFAEEFTLISTTENTGMNRVTLDRPGLNGNPQAIIAATPIGDTEALNPHPIGAWYYGGKWNIHNTDGSRFVPGLRYKILYFPTPGPDAFLHIITKANRTGDETYIDNIALKDRPNIKVLILQNHAPEARPAYALNEFQTAIRYNPSSKEWYIKNLNGRSFYPNTTYNVVILPDPTGEAMKLAEPSAAKTPRSEIAIQPRPGLSRIPEAGSKSKSPCDGVDTANVPGRWLPPYSDDLAEADRSFPAEKYRALLTKLQKVTTLVKAANETLTGVNARSGRGIRGSSLVPGGALPYRVTTGYFSYFCVMGDARPELQGKVVPGSETGTWIEILFNSFGNLLNQADADRITLFPRRVGELRGMPLFEIPESSPNKKHQVLILTMGDKLPYTMLSREDYINERIKTAKRDSAGTGSAEIASLTTALRRLSPAERQLPAIVRNLSALPDQGSLFVSDREGGHPVAKLNPDYFNPALPRTTGQYAVVSMRWLPGAWPIAAMMQTFQQDFDFETLRQMLGK